MMSIKQLLVLVLLMGNLLISGTAYAQLSLPDRPEPPRLVNDFAGVLSGDQAAMLERKLDNFNQRTSTQIAIAIVTTLSGNEPADFSFRLAEKWGIGQKGKNNGILIMVKPKTIEERGEVFVAVGYGLEGVVPDAVARQALVAAELLPNFRKNDYFTGLDRSTDVLIGLTKGEFTADQYVKSVNKRHKPLYGFGTIMFLLLVIFLIKGRSNRYNGYSSGSDVLGGILLMDMFSGRHGGSWNDFSGGGGDSGGGFGGFGGGSFGGGGAGGSW